MSKKNDKAKKTKSVNNTKQEEMLKESTEEIKKDNELIEQKEEQTSKEENKKVIEEKEVDKNKKEEQEKDEKQQKKKNDEKAKKVAEAIAEEKKKNKKMPKEYEAKANKNIFKNVIIAIVILMFCILKILGYMNIREETFIVDLKVFSISILIFSIILFEKSYKDINLSLFIHGIEALFISIITLCEVYIYQLFTDKFVMVIAIEAILISVYYIIKCIRIYRKTKKEYLKSLSDISEIVKEEKIIKIETHRKRAKKENNSEEKTEQKENKKSEAKKEKNKKK